MGTVRAFSLIGRRIPKYRARRVVTVDGKFDSRMECARYQVLKLLLQAGSITDLKRQVRFPLVTGRAKLIGYYVADFTYRETDTGTFVVEDVKGIMPPLSAWKLRHFEAQYGFPVRVTGKARLRARKKKAAPVLETGPP